MADEEPPAEGPRRGWRLVRADSSAIPPSLRRFMERAQPKHLLRKVLGNAIAWRLVALGVALVAGLSWLVFASPALAVRQIEVVGTLMLDAEQVRQVAMVPAGTPLARVDVAGVRKRVAALPIVRDVTVSRSWPATLEIVIIERKPLAAAVRGKVFDLFDEDGVIFRTVPHAPSSVVRVKLADNRGLRLSAVTVIKALTSQLRAEVVTIVVDGPARIRLELRKGRVVTWGDAQESVEKAKVATALLAQPGDRIDVSAPDVVTIR